MLKNTLTPDALAQYFDHTLLRADAVDADFEQLCAQSADYHFKMVAINPAPVRLCKGLLEGKDVRVGAAIGFPLGQSTMAVKRLETLDAIENGADEIDYVINIGALRQKRHEFIAEEMDGVVQACREHGVTSKVIFENCYLTDAEKEALCKIALEVGPDYVKTSTGFGTGGATLADVRLMLDAVGGRIKVKAAGGIRDLETALTLIDMGVSRIGSTASVAIVEAFRRTL